MAVQMEEVKDLAGFEPGDFLVTSFFLNVDATEFTSDDLLRTSFDSTIHEAESRRKDFEGELSHDSRESVRSDLAKIREWFEDIERTDTKGVAIFACSGENLFEVIQMSTPVESGIRFGRRPYLAPVATFLSHTKPTAVLVTDKQQARIFTMNAGDVREWTDFEDWVPQRTTQGGWSQNRYQRRSDKFAQHHLDKAAELTLKLLQHYPFDWLILGIEEQYRGDLADTLHPYLKDRVIGEIHVRIDAPAAEILEKAQEAREQKETSYVDTLMHQIQEYAGAGGRGTIGLTDTLQALNEQKVHILLAQQGFSHPGAECEHCGMLMAEPVTSCPGCTEPATEVDNVADSAIQRALELGSVVEIATEFDKLEPIDCIGAVLYY